MRLTNQKGEKGHRVSRLKRGLTLVVICLGLFLPIVTVFGAELFNLDGLKAECSDRSWSATKSYEISGSIAGTKSFLWDKSNNTSLTFTNSTQYKGKLTFKYTATAGNGDNADIKIDGSTVVGKGQTVTEKTFTKEEWTAGAALKIELASGKGTTSISSIKITDISFAPEVEVTLTFKRPQGEDGADTVNGSYAVVGADGVSTTVDANTSPAGLSKTQLATEQYKLIANPMTGYKLRGWYSEGKKTFLSTAINFERTFGANDTIYPVFIPVDAPVWEVGTEWFTDLHKALDYAKSNDNKLITLILNGTLQPGTYEVESGYTLLIPMDELKTNYTKDNYCDKDGGGIVFNDYSKPSDYRVLKMAGGAVINVKSGGALNVAGRFSAQGTGSGSKNGTPTGPHGRIDMCSGSQVNVNSGGNLYAFGYITGDNNTSDKTKGIVTVESGGLVHECFQIRDFRGGTATSSMLNNDDRVFPFYQYYVQNIEVPLTVYAGAMEHVYSGIYMSKKTAGITVEMKTPTGQVPFIGNADAGLFRISSGYITRTYKSAEDRVYYDVHGEVSLGQINLTISSANVKSGAYVLPIYENIELSLHNSTATVQQELALLPGVKFSIDEDSKFVINSSYNCYVYDKTQWQDSYYYSGVQRLPYTAATMGKRTQKDSATIDVNGEVQVSGGFYTTADGANIISSNRMGRVIYNTAVLAESKQPKLSRAVQSSTKITYSSITITSARLRNDITNPQYTDTTGTAAGTTYVYMEDRWGKPIEITFDPGTGGTGTLEPISTVIGKEIQLPTKDDASAKLTRAGYRITGWNTAADGSGTPYDLGALKSFDDNVTLYAQWVIAGYKLKFLKGADAATGKMPDQSFESEAESVTLNACAFAYEKYAFSGWVDQDGKTYRDQEVIARENLPTKDLTLTAQWVRVGYTITYKNGGGYGEDTTQDYDVRYKFTLKKGNYTRMNYKFIGWSETNGAGVATYKDEQIIPAGSLAKDVTLYAVWQELPVVTFDYNYDDAAPGSHSVHVTQTYEVTMEKPSRDRYRFDGWAKTRDGEVEFTAEQECIFKESITLYARWTREVTITFKANDADATPTTDHIVYGYEGENVTMPDATLFSHKYYELLGWDADSTKTANPTYTFGQVIQTPTEDMTLYAIWRHPAYDITITWEPLKFNYIRTYKWNPNALKYEQIENSWRNENQAGVLVTSGAGVEIINKSQDPLSRVSATVTYVPKEGFASYLMQYGTSAGVFNNTLGEGDRAYKTGVLSCNGVASQKIYLMLGNQPDKALDKAIVGTVNVSFQREPKI